MADSDYQPRWGSSAPADEAANPADVIDEDEGELGALPLFASEENQKLDLQVKQKTRKLDKIEKDLQENKARVDVMADHLKNVQQELKHTQALVDTKQREIQTEEHLKQLADREMGRIQQTLEKEVHEKEDAQDRLNIVQNAIFKANEKMDKFKLNMNWNQEELEQWALAAKQKEEDNLAMAKYTRADEAKIKELTLALEKITVQCNAAKEELEAEVTETQAKQIELDKTADEFRALHRERQQLVRQWQESLESMKRRDVEIGEAGEKYAESMEVLNEKQATLQDNVDMLEMQEKDNKELQGKIEMRDRIVSAHREEHGALAKKLSEFEDQTAILRNELQKASTDLMTNRTGVLNTNGVLEEKKARLEAARKRYQKAKRDLDRGAGQSDKVESRAKAAEDNLKGVESDLKSKDKGVTVMKEKMFKMSQELFKRRQEEANMIAEISGAQASSKNLTDKIRRLDAQALRQQELIYNAEFQIQQLERRVARASGVRTDEEKFVLNKKIEQLKAVLKTHTDQNAMLNGQSKKLDDELRRTERQRVDLEKTKAKVHAEIEELDLSSSAAATELSKLDKQRETTMVDNDVMKLEVKRLKQILSAKSDEVYGLENRKFQLSMSMQERKQEIQVHMEVQRAQLKSGTEQRHKVAMELREREMKVSALKAKFETLSKSMSFGDDDEDGGERSQAYYVIKAAQKREELQREGDELDSKIRTAEREIRALEATLHHLVDRNQEFRTGFQKADMDGRTAAQLQAMEQQVKQASDGLFKRRKELQRVANDLEDDQGRAQQIQEQLKHLSRHKEHLLNALQMVRKELNAEGAQLDAAKGKVAKCSRAHRRAAGVGASAKTAEEKAMHAKAIHENNENVLYTLKELANEFPEMQSALMVTLQKEKLQMPERPPSRASSVGSRPSSAGY